MLHLSAQARTAQQAVWLAVHSTVDIPCEGVKRFVHLCRSQRRRLDEQQPVPLGVVSSLFKRDCARVLQVRFVPDQHDYRPRLCELLQFGQPYPKVAERLRVGDVVDEKRAESVAVEHRSHRPEPLLPRRIPHLYLDHLRSGHAQVSRRELDADGRTRLQLKLVASEAEKELRLAHVRVAYEHDLEQVVVLVASLVAAQCLDERQTVRLVRSLERFNDCRHRRALKLVRTACG